MKNKATMSIIIFNFIVFAITLGGNLFVNVLGNAFDYTFGHWQLWRLLTCMFVHSGISHILCNTISLIQLGTVVESIYGKENFYFIYFVSGIGASICSALINGLLGFNIISIGASGAICGLLGFIFGSLKGNVKNKLISFIFAIAPMIIVGISGGNVDNIAHFGGIATGFLIGRLFVRLGIKDDK